MLFEELERRKGPFRTYTKPLNGKFDKKADVISIADDFSPYPVGRFSKYQHPAAKDCSGEAFRKNFLIPAIGAQLDGSRSHKHWTERRIIIKFAGCTGPNAGWLKEAFGNLRHKEGYEKADLEEWFDFDCNGLDGEYSEYYGRCAEKIYQYWDKYYETGDGFDHPPPEGKGVSRVVADIDKWFEREARGITVADHDYD